eukprot:scaffold122301_cov66-Phaeocystis_antarctica.AAC.3
MKCLKYEVPEMRCACNPIPVAEFFCLPSPHSTRPAWLPQITPTKAASMLAFQAFHIAAYHFAHGTFQPTAAGSARGCSELDSLLGGGPGLFDLNAVLDVCFDAQFSCSHAQ